MPRIAHASPVPQPAVPPSCWPAAPPGIGSDAKTPLRHGIPHPASYPSDSETQIGSHPARADVAAHPATHERPDSQTYPSGPEPPSYESGPKSPSAEGRPQASPRPASVASTGLGLQFFRSNPESTAHERADIFEDGSGVSLAPSAACPASAESPP
jgi:hypothetical protein